MRQADILMESEGDHWLARNRAKLGKSDPVSRMVEDLGFKPKHVLEIGCANGWRLAEWRDRYACDIVGVEPSFQAGIEAALDQVPIYQITADALPFGYECFDHVIFGFCLYLADPADWLKIAAEADRVLKTGGHLIIHDFAEPDAPFARPYAHRDDLLAYHIDWSKLWLANPLYFLVSRRILPDDEMVTVLMKRPVDAIEVRR